MAHVPAERCLGIIELLAAEANSLPLGEIARMTDARVRELALLVMQSAADLSSLWPLQPRNGATAPAKPLAETASI